MKYIPKLLVRWLLCFVPLGFFEFFLTPLTVYLTYAVLWPFYKPILLQSSIFIGDYEFAFISACIAVAAYYLIWILVMLTKDIDIKTRAKMIETGFLMLLGMNVLRVVVLIILAMTFGQEWFDVVHFTFWKFLSGLYVAIVWIFLVWYYKIDSIPVYDDLKFLYKMATKRKQKR